MGDLAGLQLLADTLKLAPNIERVDVGLESLSGSDTSSKVLEELSNFLTSNDPHLRRKLVAA